MNTACCFEDTPMGFYQLFTGQIVFFFSSTVQNLEDVNVDPDTHETTCFSQGSIWARNHRVLFRNHSDSAFLNPFRYLDGVQLGSKLLTVSFWNF
jgi:hypothetical protein